MGYPSDWIKKLDEVLTLNKRELLTHAGKISHEMALKKSNEEFEKYQERQHVIEKEQSLKEIEGDMKQLQKNVLQSNKKTRDN